MSAPRVILFVFAGRKPNIEIALPYYHRILDENPDTEVHIWDLARDPDDSQYLRDLPEADRFRIRTDFYQGDGKAMRGQNGVWQHYTGKEYRDTVFVKLDDDVVFIETAGIPGLIQAAADNPKAVVSALIVNNGACTRHIPAVWDIFKSLEPTLPKDNTPYPELASLLAVHRSGEYAELCHRWFHTNWRQLCDQTPQLLPCEDWLSINAIAYTHATGAQIEAHIGSPSPQKIVAGRPQKRLGDEGSANLRTRYIYTGVVCGHLTYGPQCASSTNPDGMGEALLTELRKLYGDITRQYLT